MTFNEVLLSSCRVLDPCSVSRENCKNDKEILKKLSQDIIQVPNYHCEAVSDYSDLLYTSAYPSSRAYSFDRVYFREGIQVKISIYGKRSPPT
jgi:hypothetical protein